MTDPVEPLDPSDPRDDDTEATTRRRRGLLVAVAAVLVAAAVVVALVVRGADDGADVDPSGSGSSAATPAPAPGGAATPDDGSDGTEASEGTDASEGPAEDPGAREQPPVPLDASPVVTDGITLRVESLTAVDGQAALPGEIGGPAVSVTVVVDNASEQPFDLAGTVVNAYSGPELTPANGLSTGTSAFPAEAPAGTTTTATYVFSVPADERDQVRVTVDTAVDLPTVVFEGAAD